MEEHVFLYTEIANKRNKPRYCVKDCHLTQICSKRTIGLGILKQRAFVGNAVFMIYLPALMSVKL